MPTPLIPDMAVFQRRLATLPLATYQAGETVLQNADTAFIPLLRRHTVEMNVVGVIEAVTSIFLDFP
jgi:hypothetical protein